MKHLNQLEFDVLVEIEAKQPYPAASFADALSGDVAAYLVNMGFASRTEDGYSVTEAGYAFLEPHRVQRAIMLAAGFGSRMMPVTKDLPKPLVPVRGVPFIETLIGALLEKGIRDITIVTGYLGEKFAPLQEKYPFIRFLRNDRYETENNISSAMLVKDLYAGAYVMDADLFLMNRDIIRKYEYDTNYLGIPVEETDDWCFKMEGDRATAMVRGGKNTFLMLGLSYWSPKDGQTFASDAAQLYKTEKGKQMFWDDVALTVYPEHYRISVRPCSAEDIFEVDSFDELLEADPSYASYLNA